MAGLLLAGIGSAVGGAIGGSFLTISMATIGQTIGTVIGTQIDNWLFAPTIKSSQEGPRLQEANVMTSVEGVSIPRGYGRFKTAGNLIWSSRLREEVVKETQKSGGKGGGGGSEVTTTSYEYYANIAIGLCEGEILDIHRVWADGKLVNLEDYTYRVYRGTETQNPDSMIETKEGSGNVPAYRGLAYIVFENMLINKFGNRIPQLTFEVTRPVTRSDADGVADLVTGVDLIPGTTEFGYDPEIVEQVIYDGDDITERRVENNHTGNGKSDWENALDQMGATLPNCNIVTFVVTWFGDDLRIGNCTIKPKVENHTKSTTLEGEDAAFSWRVAGLNRSDAGILSVYEGNSAFGGSPNDLSIYRAIIDLKARGYEVMFYPFIIMDIESGNSLANPYSDNAASSGQTVYPWRGRITCSPAIGYVGTVDQTAAAQTQIDAFLGTADASEFSGSGGTVTYSGTAEWSFNHFILHMAELCRQAGGVDYFCIGTEMVGATTIRDNTNAFPFVDGLVTLAGEVSTLLPSAQIGYAADWSEYHSYRPDDGTGDVYFNMDTLWSHADIDFIGIDNYLPMSDWRDGTDHDDYGTGNDSYGNAKGESLYDLDYLKGQIEGGEYYDYYYADASARASQVRTEISDGAYSKPWVYRNKDIKNWWSSPHYHRPYGDEFTSSVTNTYTYSEDIGTSTFALGSSVASDQTDAPRTGELADELTIDGSTGVHGLYKSIALTTGQSYTVSVYAKRSSGQYRLFVNVAGGVPGVIYDLEEGSVYASTPAAQLDFSYGIEDVGGGWYRCYFSFTHNYAWAYTAIRTGFTDSGLFNPPFTGDGSSSFYLWGFQLESGLSLSPYVTNISTGSTTQGTTLSPWSLESKPIIFTEYGCPAINKGTNQPNVFYDPKSSESSVPYFSSGGRDDEIQRQYIRAMVEYWSDTSNNPASGVYSGRMVDTSRMNYWSYDARPWPTFPMDGDTWADQANWQYGHWISGRIDTVFVPDLLEQLAEDYNLTVTHDFSRAYGTCDGFVLQSKTSFRSAVEPLASVFMFDIIESGDTLKAVSQQESLSVATVTLDDIADAGTEEPVTFTDKPSHEMPKAMTIKYLDIFKDYEMAAVSQRREVVASEAEPSADTPIVIDYARAQQLVDKMLYSVWAKKTTADFGLLPEYLFLEAGDVVTIEANGFSRPMRIQGIADAAYRQVTSMSFDLGIFQPGGGASRTQPLQVMTVATAPIIAFMDLPMLQSTNIPFQPYVAAYVNPWPGVNVFKSATDSNYSKDTTVAAPTVLGETTDVFDVGVTDVWDSTNELKIKLYSGELETLEELNVLNGGNSLAIENSTGGWEVLQFVNQDLTGTRTYTLTKLLRGQLGTEDNMETNLPAGARVVLLESTIQQMSLGISDIGREYYLKYGPASKDIGDNTYRSLTQTFTGRGLRPYSVVHVTSENDAGDITISWVRRTRINGDNWDYTDDVPLNEAFEKYEIDVLDGGGSVVRTLTVTDATEVVYTAAQQSADGISTPFEVDIYQISDQIGRGIKRRATING